MHLDWNALSGARKADDRRDQPRDQAMAAIDVRQSFGAAFAVDVMHLAKWLRQRMPRLA